MMSRKGGDETEFFWDLVEPLLAADHVDEGTLMGFPCLRVNGDFFGTCDHRSGHLIVKLSRDRVGELIDEGVGAPFAPAGRVFKEWVLVEERDGRRWLDLLAEAKTFVGGQ
jgi:hypothetical protein